MKAILLCLIFIFNFTALNVNLSVNVAFASKTYFAKIMQENTPLYSSQDQTSIIFYLPNTYYVELISSSNNTYYAKYNDIYGYVNKNMVKPISTVPANPYLTNIAFRVFVPSGANLRSTPENLGAVNLLYSIPFLETNLLYYGIANGEEAISKKGTTWYYCKYFNNNISYTGYVYAPLCDCLSPITSNTEDHPFIEGELKFEDEIINTGTTNGMESLSSTSQTIIIVAISLPCLLFIYLLFKPTKMAESVQEPSKKPSSKKSKPKKISRLKHSDYFEIDD